jgi:hypothetical protein
VVCSTFLVVGRTYTRRRRRVNVVRLYAEIIGAVAIAAVSSWISYKAFNVDYTSILQEKDTKIVELTTALDKEHKRVLLTEFKKVETYDPATGKLVKVEYFRLTKDSTTDSSHETNSSTNTDTHESNSQQSNQVAVTPRTNHVLGGYGLDLDGNKIGSISYLKELGIFDVGASLNCKMSLTGCSALGMLGLSF